MRDFSSKAAETNNQIKDCGGTILGVKMVG